MKLTIMGTRKRIGILAALAILCACGVASARFRAAEQCICRRRAKLRAGVDGPIVIYGYMGHEDASEVAIFFQEPSFYYLTGHDEPGAVLVIVPNAAMGVASDGGKALETLYLPARDPKEEVWEGPENRTGRCGHSGKNRLR